MALAVALEMHLTIRLEATLTTSLAVGQKFLHWHSAVVIAIPISQADVGMYVVAAEVEP